MREGLSIRISSRMPGVVRVKASVTIPIACLLLLLQLLQLLAPKQYEEVREGLSVSEGGFRVSEGGSQR